GFRLCLVGEGPLRRSLESESSNRDLSDVVSFVGPRPQAQLPDWYRAADVTVLPSRSEGIPNVLRESLACGTPFVATRVGGIPEIANGHAAQLVPPGNSSALAEAIDEMITRGAPTDSHLPTWKQAARSLMKIVEPLVAV